MRDSLRSALILLSVVVSGSIGAVAEAAALPAEPPEQQGPPPFPDPAAQPDTAGAAYFASHWLDLIDYGQRTRDAEPLRDLSLPSCRSCAQLTAGLDHDRAAGTRYEGGDIKFVGSEPTLFDPAHRAEVLVSYDAAVLRVLDSDGKPLQDIPGGRTYLQFDLSWTSEGWRTAAIKQGEPAPPPPGP